MKKVVVIRRLEDIKAASRLDENIEKWLKGLFRSIAEAYTDGGAWESFSLDAVGPIVFLESSEDCANLSLAGLRGAYRDTCPEVVELHPLKDADGELLWLYVSTVVRNNSETVTLCSIEGSLDGATEAFLRDNAS